MWILTNRFWEYNKTCMLMILLFDIKWPNLLCFIEKWYFNSLPPHRNLIFFRQSAPSHIMMYTIVNKSVQQEEAENISKNRPETKIWISRKVGGAHTHKKSCCLSQWKAPRIYSHSWNNLCLHKAIKNPTVCIQQRLEMSCQDVNTAGGIIMCSWACHQQMRLTKRKISLNYLEECVQ